VNLLGQLQLPPRPPKRRPELHRVLAIGGEVRERHHLADLLAKAAIELIQAVDGCSGLRAFYTEHPHAIVTDLKLGDISGLELLARLRELSKVPVIVVTGPEGEGGDRARCLRAGADDCVTRPIDGPELVARIESVLRRSRVDVQAVAVLEDEYIHIDRLQHRVEVLGVEVALTPTEFRMLATFAENPGRVLDHGQLLEMVWGSGLRERDEVKLYVSYLRRKLNKAAKVDPVETVRGVGYRYRPRRIPLSFERFHN
jgi:DNA-binding response OmpR family regulator